jgi:hypothetical protein
MQVSVVRFRPWAPSLFQIWQCGAFRDFVPLAKKWHIENPDIFCSARSRLQNMRDCGSRQSENFRVTSAVGASGRESGHGHIDAIDP